MLSFNWFGYRLLSSFLEEKANVRMAQRLDSNHYNEAELVSLKISSDHLPYANNSGDFHRMNGQLELNGMQYNFVKWRLYNDSLEFLCMPNPIATKLQTARIDFYKLVNDIQNETPGKKTTPSGSSKNFSFEYYPHTEYASLSAHARISSQWIIPVSADIPLNFPSLIDYPPEHHC